MSKVSHNKKNGRKKFICETGEIYIEGQRSQIFRSDNRTRQYKDRKGKSSESSRLANVKEYKECTEVFRVSTLL